MTPPLILPPPKTAEVPVAVTDPDILRGFLSDASRMVGEAASLYRPRSTAEVSAILQRLNAASTSVTVVARQTSTTGSSVPLGGAILSMEHLHALRFVDPARGLARAQAGILLGDFQGEVERRGRLYPPDPTSRNESTLGASVACNASGARTFKYGATRGYVEALQVVLADGGILEVRRGDCLANAEGVLILLRSDGTPLRIPVPDYPQPVGVKHAAGYHSGKSLDLIDLFIGSEGTLGVITEVEVRLLPLPARVISILATWSDESNALRFVQAARSRRQEDGLDPRCIEWLDANSLRIIADRFPDPALPGEARAAVFFEQECTPETEDTMLALWLELLEETGALTTETNGVLVADTAARQQMLHALRHAVPAGVNERAARNGMPKLGTDLAVPDAALIEIMALYHQAVRAVPQTLGLQAALEVMCEVAGMPLLEPAGSSEEGLRDALGRLTAWLEEVPTRHARGPAALHEGHRDAETAAPTSRARALEAVVLSLWSRLELPLAFDYATFGHIGDNHVHVNLLPTSPGGLLAARKLYDVMTRRAIALGGTVSAEHGIGKLKRKALLELLGPDAIAQMRRVKRALDPRGILGQGNLFEP